MNGEQDNTVPYGGGLQFGITFLSAEATAYRFAQTYGWSGYNIQEQDRDTYGAASQISNYGDVIWLNDDVGHVVSADMKRLLNKFLENNYDITY